MRLGPRKLYTGAMRLFVPPWPASLVTIGNLCRLDDRCHETDQCRMGRVTRSDACPNWSRNPSLRRNWWVSRRAQPTLRHRLNMIRIKETLVQSSRWLATATNEGFSSRHCEPPARRKAPSASEAIHRRVRRAMDCFVARAPRNDGGSRDDLTYRPRGLQPRPGSHRKLRLQYAPIVDY
jgi:hypothetical protein